MSKCGELKATFSELKRTRFEIDSLRPQYTLVVNPMLIGYQPEYQALLQNADMMRYLNPTTPSLPYEPQYQAPIDTYFWYWMRSPHSNLWMIDYHDELAGHLRLTRVSELEANIGLILLPRFWHKAIAPTAFLGIMQALADTGFENVSFETRLGNIRSRKLMERLQRLGLTSVETDESFAKVSVCIQSVLDSFKSRVNVRREILNPFISSYPVLFKGLKDLNLFQ